jgi:hypothetical protein
MADSSIPITAGTGTNVDTRTTTGGEHREVVVIGGDGDPVTTLTTGGSKIALDVNIASSAGGVAAATGTFTNVANSAVTAAVTFAGNVTVSIIGGNFVNLPIIFEGSADGGTNWFAVDATQADGTGTNTQIILPANGGPRNWNIPAPGYTHVRVRMTGTATTFTTTPTVNINQGPFLYDPSPTVPPIDGQKATYSIAVNPAGANGVNNTLDAWNFGNPTGSGKTIRIIALSVQVSLATAAAGIVQITKRSAANTGGTQATVTRTGFDSSDPVSVATGGGAYTAAPTAVGTAIGVLRQYRANLAVSPGTAVDWTFGNRPAKAIVLRPGEYLGLQVLSATGAAPASAPTVTGFVEWTEE